MATRTRLARNFYSAMLGFGLLSLVFLGSPGCGCGDDDLRVGSGDPERCCCTFEWLPPRIADGEDVTIEFHNVDAGLDPEATPALLTEVDFQTLETFTVCVNEEHLLGSQLGLTLWNTDTDEVYTDVLLIYETRCEPVIEPLSDYVNLTSTDCGESDEIECCCEFEWLPGPNQAGDVEIVALSASPGLNPVITPSTLFSVGPDAVETFTVCVDFDHPLGAQFDLVIQQAGGGGVLGIAQLIYNTRCTPEITPLTKGALLNLRSTDCGDGTPLLCCCNFQWLPPVGFFGNVFITAENVSAGLSVEITPPSLEGVVPRTLYSFQVCINADHNLLDAFDLVITPFTDQIEPELGRSRVTYRERCRADVEDIPGTQSLFLTTTDCGGEPIQCCCDIQWNAPSSTWNPPPGPWTATLENVEANLQTATISPSSIDVALQIPSSIVFTVCVNPLHAIGAEMEIVLRSSGGVEFSRFWLVYAEACLPFDNDSSGEGDWVILCQPQEMAGD